MNLSRIEREKRTVGQMIGIYCRTRHGGGLCPECSELLAYACFRLDHCRFGNAKGTCKQCRVHCYKPAMRERMRSVMRFAGPRMLWHHPVAAIRHMCGI